MPVRERKRIVIEETDDGCVIQVWNSGHRKMAAPDKIEVFEVGIEARDFLVSECNGFPWGGTP